jgi:hypothetical protein
MICIGFSGSAAKIISHWIGQTFWQLRKYSISFEFIKRGIQRIQG